MAVLKRIGVISFARIYAIFGIMFGLLAAISFNILGGVTGGYALGSTGILTIIILPLIYGGLSFIFAAIMAIIYNVIAPIAGGVELEL